MALPLCLENKLIYGADVSNAFAEAAAPVQQYFMRVDVHFRDWWASKGRSPIPADFVIPILKNLKGHPDAPHQWFYHIDNILQTYQFIPTAHAPCIYRATINKENVIFLCQVDDFAMATNNEQLYTQICNSLDTNFLVLPMKRQGLLTHNDGLDIVQTRTFITASANRKHLIRVIHLIMAII